MVLKFNQQLSVAGTCFGVVGFKRPPGTTENNAIDHEAYIRVAFGIVIAHDLLLSFMQAFYA